MKTFKTLTATLCVAAACVLASTETANAQVGWYYGSPGIYSGTSYGGGYYGGLGGSRVVQYSAVNPINGIGYGYSYSYPGYSYGYGLPTAYTPFGYYGYTVRPAPQYGFGAYSYTPTYFGY